MKRSLACCLFLILSLTGCLQQPQPVQEPKTPQEDDNSPPIQSQTYISAYSVSAPGVRIAELYLEGPLNSDITPHVEFFQLEGNLPQGLPLGKGLYLGASPSETEGSVIRRVNGKYPGYYLTWNIREYAKLLPKNQPIRMEFRSDKAAKQQPACEAQHIDAKAIDAGCLAFIDFKIVLSTVGSPDTIFMAPLSKGVPRATKTYSTSIIRFPFKVEPHVKNYRPVIIPMTNIVRRYSAGEKVVLRSEATDVEDGDISANTSWSSSIDGALGTGSSIVKALSVGTHMITARVSDSVGKTAYQVYTGFSVEDAKSQIFTLPEGWVKVIYPHNRDSGSGQVMHTPNVQTPENKRFSLQGYQSGTFIAKPLTAQNAEFKGCLVHRGHKGSKLRLGINKYFQTTIDESYLQAPENSLTMQSLSNLLGSWATITIDGLETPAQIQSSVTDNSIFKRPLSRDYRCYLIEKKGELINVYEANRWGKTFDQISKDDARLLTSYTLELTGYYFFFAGLDTTDPSVQSNSRGFVELAVTELPDDESPEDDDPEADPNTETVQSSINLETDVGLAQSNVTSSTNANSNNGGTEFIFDASASRGTGLKYQWNLGDGKTSDKAVVYHVYDKPGKYDVSLQITNSVGRQNQLKQTVYVFPTIEGFIPALSDYRSIKFDPTQGGRNVTFNLGELFEGFRYEVDLGHNNQKVTRRKGEEATIKHTYPLGTYTYTVKIYDERKDKNANARAGVFGPQQLADDQPVVEESTWFTLWSDAPSAKFSMSNPNDKTEIGADGKSGKSDENGDFYGNLPLSIDFDASGTQAAKNNRNAELVYSWDFGDGSPSEEGKDKKTTKHTYTKEGLHLVTLTVKDPDTNLTDSYQAFVKAKYPGHDALVSLVYPEAELRTTALSLLDQAHFAVDDGLALQADVPILKDKFPYVMVFDEAKHKEKIRFSIKQDHNDFFCDPVANNYVYDKYYDATLNNGEKNIPIGNAFYRAKVNLYNDNVPSQGGLCDVWLSKPNLLKGLIRAANNTLGIRTSRQDLRTEIDTIASLRVPRVYVAILPDSMIAGNLPSPNIVEKRANNKVTGEEELILMVQVRESDVDQLKRKVTFDVPAYGVDEKGRKVNANGYFNARFAGEDSDCGDCVMVDGRTTISLTVPLPSQKKPKATFKLDKVVVSRDGSCTSDSYSDLNMFVSRCISINTSYRVPENAPSNITAFDYPIAITPAASAGSNQITILSDLPNPLNFMRDTVQSTWNWFNDLSFRDVGIFVYNLIPFVSDGVDLLNQLRITYLTDKEADIVITTFASVGLVLDATTGGLLDVTAFFKASYKVSLRIARRQGGGSLAKIFKDEIINLLAGSMSPLDLITSMKNTFGQVVTVGKACGLTGAVRCFGQLDISVTQLAGLDNVNFKVAADRFDDGLKAAKRNNLAVGCFLEMSSFLTDVYTPMDILVWFSGLEDPVLTSQSLTSQGGGREKNPSICNDLRQGSSTYRPKAQKFWRAKVEGGNVKSATGQALTSQEQKDLLEEINDKHRFEYHHIVSRNERDEKRCGKPDPKSGLTKCGESRRILMRFNVDIITDSTNLVPLPKEGISAPTFQKYFPKSTKHSRKAEGIGAHSTAVYKSVYERLKKVEQDFKDELNNSNSPAQQEALRNKYQGRIQDTLQKIAQEMWQGNFK